MTGLECENPHRRERKLFYLSVLFVLIADTRVPVLGICTLKGVLKDYESFS